MMPRACRLVVASVLLLASCHPGRDPRRLLGRWEGAAGTIEFFDGRVLLRTAAGASEGRYAQLSRDHIRVHWGGRWPSGEPQRWRALAERGKLAVCELRNGRHCMQFHRPGEAPRITPR